MGTSYKATISMKNNMAMTSMTKWREKICRVKVEINIFQTNPIDKTINPAAAAKETILVEDKALLSSESADLMSLMFCCILRPELMAFLMPLSASWLILSGWMLELAWVDILILTIF